MPPGKAFAPWALPAHFMISKTANRKKPNSKILWMFLAFIRYYFTAGGNFFVCKLLTSQLAITSKFRHIEIDGLICLIGNTLIKQQLHNFYLLINKIGGSGVIIIISFVAVWL